MRMAGSDNSDCSGIGSAPGLASLSQAWVQADLSWREYLPVRPLERTVSREVASTNFWRRIGEHSDSTVASQTEPVHAPLAPIAKHAAICRPVMIPPAA